MEVPWQSMDGNELSLVEGMTRDFPSLKLTCPPKNDGGKTNSLLKWFLFRGTFVHFRGGICLFARCISFEFAFFSLFSFFLPRDPRPKKDVGSLLGSTIEQWRAWDMWKRHGVPIMSGMTIRPGWNFSKAIWHEWRKSSEWGQCRFQSLPEVLWTNLLQRLCEALSFSRNSPTKPDWTKGVRIEEDWNGLDSQSSNSYSIFLQEKNRASSHDYFTVPVTVLSSMLPVLEMSSWPLRCATPMQMKQVLSSPWSQLHPCSLQIG